MILFQLIFSSNRNIVILPNASNKKLTTDNYISYFINWYNINSSITYNRDINIYTLYKSLNSINSINRNLILTPIEHTPISAYAPTLETTIKSPDVTEMFYSELESVIKLKNSRDTLLIGGDFNAKITIPRNAKN